MVQVVRRNSSLELPVGHDLFHLTFKSEQHAETHRIVRDKFKNSAAYEKLSGNSETIVKFAENEHETTIMLSRDRSVSATVINAWSLGRMAVHPGRSLRAP